MNITQIYTKYNIPQNLQEHMLRVAALSQILTENWQGIPLNKEAIVTTCLFHDMANIIKFKFDNPVFKMTAQEIQHWKRVKQKTIENYGDNIHAATLAICQEIGLNNKVLDLVNKLEWDNVPKMLNGRDFESCITIYSDMRIGPFGIMSLKDRIDDLQARNPSKDMNTVREVAAQLEKALQQHIAIDVDTVTDAQINGRFDQLRKREL